MRKIREVLRLKFDAHLSDRQIATALASARSTGQECLSRGDRAGIDWPLAPELSELELQDWPYRRSVAPKAAAPMSDFAAVHRELARRGVTRWLLWQEYKVPASAYSGRLEPSSGSKGCVAWASMPTSGRLQPVRHRALS